MEETEIENLQSDDEKIELLDTIKSKFKKVEIIKSLNSDEKKLKLLGTIESNSLKVEVIQSLKDDDIKLQLAIKTQDEFDREEILLYVKDDMKKIQVLNRIKEENEEIKVSIIRSINDEELRFMQLSEIKGIEQRRNVRIQCLSSEIIAKNIKKIMLLEGITNDVDKKINQLKQMAKKNDDVYKTIVFEFLDEKYQEIFDRRQIDIIACYPYIQEKIVKLNDKELAIINKCIKDNKKEYDIWTINLENILRIFENKEYENLLNNIDLENLDINKLNVVLQDKNYFNIKTIEDFNNHQTIKKYVCDLIINGRTEEIEKYPQIQSMSEVERYQFAILEKMYGQDISSAQKIVNKYAKDIENVKENSEVIDYVKSLKLILETKNIEQLKQYYDLDLGLEEKYINPRLVEFEIKKLYSKQYTNLTKVDDLKKQEDGTYLVDSNFNMIVTSIGSYYSYKDKIEDYAKDWNRNKIASQGICTSYITNDFITTADVPIFCYGFAEMSESSLLLSSPSDMTSNTNKINPTSGRPNEEVYYTPENQINQSTHGHNELVWARFENGKRKQPDYIVVFKENGKVHNMEQVKIAAEHWKLAGREMPIIVVDKDKCLENNKKQISKEISNCKNLEELKKIKQRIENNKRWSKQSFEEFDDMINFFEKKYKKDKDQDIEDEKQKIQEWKQGLKKAYQDTNAKQRNKVLKVIQHIVNKIKEVFER